MKNFFRIFIVAAAFLLVLSCKNVSLKQTVSGKAGEVIVVMNQAYWESEVGTELRNILATPYPYLPQQEASFTLINVTPRNFNSVLKIHRNIIIVKIDSTEQAKINILKDVWAAPQIVMEICAPSKTVATDLIKKYSKKIFSSINLIEKERIISNAKKFEEVELRKAVTESFGGSPYFPKGYSLKKKTDNFIWISYEPTYTIQSVLMYKVPYVDSTSLQLGSLLEAMSGVMKNNVPGMMDNSYMIISDAITPGYEKTEVGRNEVIEVRGLWEVENDFMGGPFIAHAYYSKDNPNEILIVEGFVYAAKFPKRNYLRQVEAILYSFDYNNGI